jgi:UDPglucose--hexose-1-phosphate uridylyltransferase
MSELRQNLATREWVIIAPERLKGKPFKGQQNPLLDTVPTHEDNCPFCPRNEERFENLEIERSPDPNAPDAWAVRCIENKFKIFEEYDSCPAVPTEFDHDGVYCRFMGCGNHELVIESPTHNKTFATMSGTEVERVVAMYLRRFRAIQANPNNLLCMIFKNHGSRSGASQVHPHSQILGMRVVPNSLRYMLDEATRHFDTRGVCVFCKTIAHELDAQLRVVYENDDFVSLVPYAASVPFEINLFPKAHASMFDSMDESLAAHFSDCLHVTMKKLYVALSNPDFNLVFRNPPYALRDVPFYHWHLQIVPHTKTPGGFELGSRIGVSVVTPEAAAQTLRDV